MAAGSVPRPRCGLPYRPEPPPREARPAEESANGLTTTSRSLVSTKPFGLQSRIPHLPPIDIASTRGTDHFMWDTAEITGPEHLPHDLLCPGCSHGAHHYLPCGDDCECVPPEVPWFKTSRAA